MRSVRPTLAIAVATISAIALVTSASAAPQPAAHRHTSVSTPLVFGHRGAAGYRPEHTSAGYELAARMGADYIEPDLVPTKDGVLVDRHEPEISGTTDVATHPEFANRRTTRTIDGVVTTGWFTTDFTLAELKTLRAVERLPAIRQHNKLYNGRYTVPTLQEDIDQWKALAGKVNRHLGLVPEIKHSTYFRSIGLPMEQRLLDVLRQNGLDRANSGIVIQSFEVGNLQWLYAHSRVPLLQLSSATGAPADFVASGDPRTYADICSAAGLRMVGRYAKFFGPDKNQIVPRDASGALLPPTPLVRFAHQAGLLVAPYTFRNENSFLPTDYRRGTDPAAYGDAFTEYELFYALGVDGVFSDNSDTAIAARDEWLAEGAPLLAA